MYGFFKENIHNNKWTWKWKCIKGLPSINFSPLKLLCTVKLASPESILANVNLWIESWWPVASNPLKSWKKKSVPNVNYALPSTLYT